MTILDRECITDTDPSLGFLLDNVQGYILESHRREEVWNFFVRFDEAATAAEIRQKLGALAAEVTTLGRLREERQARKALHEPVLALGISWPGYARIGAPDRFFYPEFLQGLRGRVYPVTRRTDEAWDPAWKAGRYHAMIVCAAEHRAPLAAAETKLRAHFAGSVVHVERGEVIRGRGAPGERPPSLEHFKFADGVSKPVFFDDPGERRPPTTRNDPKAKLGLVLVPEPFPGSGDRDKEFGSYLAYVKIEQHVDAFDKAVTAVTSALGNGNAAAARHHAGSLVLGRARDGQPLIPGSHTNDFDRASDPAGASWPLCSHTSKMNPRSGEGHDTRILRRGITYTDGASQGILFQCFQSSLANQFELHMGVWAHDPLRPGGGADPILGAPGKRTFPLAGGGTVSVAFDAPLTTVRGGEYFYFPSIPAVRALA